MLNSIRELIDRLQIRYDELETGRQAKEDKANWIRTYKKVQEVLKDLIRIAGDLPRRRVP